MARRRRKTDATIEKWQAAREVGRRRAGGWFRGAGAIGLGIHREIVEPPEARPAKLAALRHCAGVWYPAEVPVVASTDGLPDRLAREVVPTASLRDGADLADSYRGKTEPCTRLLIAQTH